MSLRPIHRLALLLVFLSLPAMLAPGCKQKEVEPTASSPASSPSVEAGTPVEPQNPFTTPEATGAPPVLDPNSDPEPAPVPSEGDVVEMLPEEEGFPEEVRIDQDPDAEPAASREWVDDGHDYYQVDFTDLQFDGELPSQLSLAVDNNFHWQFQNAVDMGQLSFSLSDPGEVFVSGPWVIEMLGRNRRVDPEESVALVVRVPAGGKVSGTLSFNKGWFESRSLVGKTEQVSFSLPAATPSKSGQVQGDFWLARASYYATLMNNGGPGAAWYRYQFGQSAEGFGAELRSPRVRRRSFGSRGNDIEETYAFMSGGRALAENLQLDRELPPATARKETVDIDTISGITVQEFDWKPLVKDLEPELDPLATHVPDDQHVLFFNDFTSMIAVMDEAKQNGATILGLGQMQSEDAGSQARYEFQLGLSLNGTVRLLGPQVIRSVAVTGGDLYLRTGTDIAILFEAVNTQALQALLLAQVNAQVGSYQGVTSQQGMVGEVPYQGFASPDRVVSSYVASLGNAVVVTNSLVQMERLVEASQQKRPSIDELDEYTFFRDRYPLGKEGQSGLLVLSDKTIRRWCGPHWRIATSRRTRALAAMTDLQAENLDKLVAGEVEPGIIESDAHFDQVGQLRLTSSGVASDRYGSLAFQTPIIEMEMSRVSLEEKQLYERWRRGYQGNWSNFFDPIAVEFSVQKDRLAADVTVMPLIDSSDYNEMIGLSRGAELADDDGDRHAEALVHFILALNTESEFMKQNLSMARSLAPQIQVDPLAWLGDYVTIYADQSDFWQELADTDPDSWDRFVQTNIGRLPVAVAVDVKSGLKLTLFLTGVRAFINEAAPGMTVWQTVKHKEQPYVKIAPSSQARGEIPDDLEDLAIYYRATGRQLLLTLNEDIIKRAIDRELEKAEPASEEEAAVNKPWLGKNVALEISPNAATLFKTAIGPEYQQQMQKLCWSNLPILNEWHQRYPDQDPVELHQRFWQRRLVCPGGGEYRWNEDLQTMESTVYGSPAAPGTGPGLPAAIDSIKSASFGLTFEENGLRTSLELQKK